MQTALVIIVVIVAAAFLVVSFRRSARGLVNLSKSQGDCGGCGCGKGKKNNA